MKRGFPDVGGQETNITSFPHSLPSNSVETHDFFTVCLLLGDKLLRLLPPRRRIQIDQENLSTTFGERDPAVGRRLVASSQRPSRDKRTLRSTVCRPADWRSRLNISRKSGARDTCNTGFEVVSLRCNTPAPTKTSDKSKGLPARRQHS